MIALLNFFCTFIRDKKPYSSPIIDSKTVIKNYDIIYTHYLAYKFKIFF